MNFHLERIIEMISTHSRIAAFALVAAMLYAMLPMNVLAASDVKTQPRNVRTATAAASAGASLEGPYMLLTLSLAEGVFKLEPGRGF